MVRRLNFHLNLQIELFVSKDVTLFLFNCKTRDTGILRAGLSRRSKTKSPYALRARLARPTLATDQKRATGPTLATDQTPTSSALNNTQIPSSAPNACGMSGLSPAVQMSTMPVLESQLCHSQGISMSASPVVAQHGTHINPLVSITSDLGSNVPLTTHEKIGIMNTLTKQSSCI